MEFTRRSFSLPPLDVIISARVGSGVDVEEVQKFQGQVEKDELKDRQRKLKSKNSLKWALLVHNDVLLIVSAILFVTSLFFPSSFVISIFLCAVFVFACIMMIRDSPYVRTIEWQTSPFSDFSKEYKGDVASKLCPCVEALCVSPLLNLTVEHHPFSLTRFLYVNDPAEEDGDKYCVDYWEKPWAPGDPVAQPATPPHQ